MLKCDKTLDFGIGDPNSTSGFLVPTTYIFAAHEHRPQDLLQDGAQRQPRGQRLAVANKQVDVATNNSENLERIARPRRTHARRSRMIWTSPLIPLDPLVWRKDLEPASRPRSTTSC